MRAKIFGLVAMAPLLFWSTPASALPISAQMFLWTTTTPSGVPPFDSDSDSFTGVPASLSIRAGLKVNEFGRDRTATGAEISDWPFRCLATERPCIDVHGEGLANFAADGNSGSVDFTDYGWHVNEPGASAVSLNDHDAHGADGIGGPDWQYTFVADFDGTFVMNYGVIGTGDVFGLQGWDILWDGAGGDLNLVNAINPNASGIFTRSVITGQTYTVGLRNNANISAGSGFTTTASMNGDFDWRIVRATDVPEPASILLMGAGLSLAARRLRKSNKRA